MVFPNSKLPSAAQPWGRFVEKSITNLETLTSVERVNNAARDAQAALGIKRLDQSVTAVAAAAIAAQDAADDAAAAAAAAQSAIDGLTSLGSIDSEYTINAGNINAGTLTGITVQTGTTGVRAVMSGSDIKFYDTDGLGGSLLGGSIYGATSGFSELPGAMKIVSSSATSEIEISNDGVYISDYSVDPSVLLAVDVNGVKASALGAGIVWLEGRTSFTSGTLPTSWQSAGKAYIADGSLRLAVNGVGLGISRPSSTGSIASFQNGSTQVGSISITASATAYNTSSDYRLKDNVVPLEGSLERLMQLKPSRFNFKAEPDKIVDGFIAHEVAEVIPEAIYGEKDGVDEEGNPEYQGIDQSKIVPLLTAAVQELAAKVATLEGK